MYKSDYQSLLDPWTPMEGEEVGNVCKAKMWGREYKLENSALFTSIVTQGEEVLSSPIRIVGTENGDEIIWEECGNFLMDSSDEKITLCGYQQSKAFIVNTAISIEYDGLANIDLKVMPKGLTVQEVFGLSEYQNKGYNLEKLWIEIPLKKKFASLYHYWPAGDANFHDKTVDLKEDVSMSGELPCSISMPFKPLAWLGSEDLGLCYFSQTDEFWNPEDEMCALEFIDGQDEVILRLRLIENKVDCWEIIDGEPETHSYMPITFKFGLQATPVKKFPEDPYKRKILHIDCFKKVLEDYFDFLSNPVVEGTDEIGFDRIKRLGVTTLVIHEKWNMVQNYWKMPYKTEWKTKEIIKQCHARDIEVVPYFGYEIATISPLWGENSKEILRKSASGSNGGGWYREPYQRDYKVCYNSSWQDKFANGIKEMVEKYKFNGIYLDTTLLPFGCVNAQHGCGYVDESGNQKETYPILAIRELMKKLYAVIDPIGGIVNPHMSNCCNIPALSFSHMNWDGEYIQMLVKKDGAESIPFGYLRAEYLGRNFGVPVEFLAYEFPPEWNFNDSLSFALIHGILPRPNDIAKPLEIMSNIWKVLDKFPIASSSWKPYWTNGNIVSTTNKNVKISFYESIDVSDKKNILMFITNPSESDLNNVRVQFSIGYFNNNFTVYDSLNKIDINISNLGFEMSYKKYDSKVFFIREK